MLGSVSSWIQTFWCEYESVGAHCVGAAVRRVADVLVSPSQHKSKGCLEVDGHSPASWSFQNKATSDEGSILRASMPHSVVVTSLGFELMTA